MADPAEKPEPLLERENRQILRRLLLASLVLIAVAAAMYWQFKRELRGVAVTKTVMEEVFAHVEAHHGKWPTGWEELDLTEATAVGDGAHPERYVRLRFDAAVSEMAKDIERLRAAIRPKGKYAARNPKIREAQEGLHDLIVRFEKTGRRRTTHGDYIRE